MEKAVIAITADTFPDTSPITNLNLAAFAPKDLDEAIIKAGGLPIILPFPYDIEKAEGLAKEQVNLFDGLVIPGGPDIDPTFFGEEPIRGIGRTTYQRDVYELALIKEAVKAGKAIFGICRGLQVINVAFGGNLYQDLNSQVSESTLKHSQATNGKFPTHHVKISEGSQLFELLGETSYVNSRHHQAIKESAAAFQITALAQDGVIEALESKEKNVLAVQWHPENMWEDYPEQLVLFTDLVKRAEKAR